MTEKKAKIEEIKEEEINKPKVKAKSKKILNKRGRTPWKPADLLAVRDKTPGWRYRWVNVDSRNISKKEREGWVYAKSTTGLKGEHDRPGKINDGGPLTSDGTTYTDQVLMGLQEEIALDRDEEMKERVRAQSHEKLQGELERDVANLGGPKAPLHGGITFD